MAVSKRKTGFAPIWRGRDSDQVENGAPIFPLHTYGKKRSSVLAWHKSWAVFLQSDGILSPVVHGDIALSINT